MLFDTNRLTARYGANETVRTTTVLQTEAVRASRFLATTSVCTCFPRTIWTSSDSPTVTQIAYARQLFECACLYWKDHLLELELRNRPQLSIRELYFESFVSTITDSFVSFITDSPRDIPLSNTNNPPEHLSHC
jgi:hypothetical protein